VLITRSPGQQEYLVLRELVGDWEGEVRPLTVPLVVQLVVLVQQVAVF
tara:strand:+ start:23 stop:166 length:144 start_codon:yes stop_codon:yes gene_type:complete